MTNPAGAQIVNAVGPIRQIVDPSEARERRRYLAIFAVSWADQYSFSNPIARHQGAATCNRDAFRLRAGWMPRAPPVGLVTHKFMTWPAELGHHPLRL
jgi:hypothetical protein